MLLNDAFLGGFLHQSKVSHYVLESLLWSQACFPWSPSVCPAVTDDPASSHSSWTALSLTSPCCYLYIKTMLCWSELVCPSPWVEPCYYFTSPQERKIWFSTCCRKCNMFSVATGFGVCGVLRHLVIFLGSESMLTMRPPHQQTYQ